MGRSFKFLAKDLGRDHGANAAGWWLQEMPGGGRNNASDAETAAWARETLARLDAGDDCGIPQSDLSGEWAGGMTPMRLAEEIGYDWENDKREAGEFLHSYLCDAYEQGFAEACEREIVRTLKRLARKVSK